jgi:hypothetical protein
MLRTKYGLTGNDPYRFVIYEREFPLSEKLAAVMEQENRRQTALSRLQEGTSCKVQAAS